MSASITYTIVENPGGTITVTATSTGKSATQKEQAATEAIHRVISERLRRCRRPGGAK